MPAVRRSDSPDQTLLPGTDGYILPKMYRRLRQRQKNGRVYAIRHASCMRQSGRNCSKQAGPQPSSADAHISDNYGTEKEKLKRATTARCACAMLYEKKKKRDRKEENVLGRCERQHRAGERTQQETAHGNARNLGFERLVFKLSN